MAGWQLQVIAGPDVGHRYPLGPNTSLGRSRDNNIQLDDAQSSRHHALNQQTGRGYVVQDLGGSNGTLVNGQRIRQTVAAKPGADRQYGAEGPWPGGAEPVVSRLACPRCGQPTGGRARFCGQCGGSLP